MKCYVFMPDGKKRMQQCQREAKWKVPMYGETEPHCVCDEHVKDWRENQPKNVKALDDDTPWPSGRKSVVARG